MRYYLDTEFNGFGGALISMAVIREDGRSFYAISPASNGHLVDPWVAEHVFPFLDSVPPDVHISRPESDQALADLLQAFLAGDSNPVIVSDWPDDIRYFCNAVITGPGMMVKIPQLKFEMHRVDAYPTVLTGAVQHNAWWDAMALKLFLTEPVRRNFIGVETPNLG